MRWKKLKNIIMEHPYLISDDFHMSMGQAERLQEEEGYPSFEEMADCARRRSALPGPAWREVYAAINSAPAAAPAPGRRKTPGIRLTARWAAAVLCVLLAAGYFALAPSGRALAYSIASVIVEIFDNGLRFKPDSASETSQQAGVYEETFTEYTDFDAVEKEFGRQFIKIKDDKYTLESLLLYSNRNTGHDLYTFYETEDGLSAAIYYSWDFTTDYWTQFRDDDLVWEDRLSDGTVVYCIKDAVDKTFSGYAVWGDMLITIYADDGIPYQEILAALGAYE